MIDKLTNTLDFNGKALALRADRQRILASNIANVDTPGYVARDFKFADAMAQQSQSSLSLPRQALMQTGGSTGGGIGRTFSSNGGMAVTSAQHLVASTETSSELDGSGLGYSLASQPSMDGNSVDLDRERAAFADNSIRYESTLRFINGHVKTMLSAIQGQ